MPRENTQTHDINRRLIYNHSKNSWNRYGRPAAFQNSGLYGMTSQWFHVIGGLSKQNATMQRRFITNAEVKDQPERNRCDVGTQYSQHTHSTQLEFP